MENETLEKEISASPEAVVTDAKQLAMPLVDGMPEVTASEKKDPEPVQVDSVGNNFDPTRHAVDEGGRPRKNRKGEFVRLGRGRPPKSATQEAAGPEQDFPKDPPQFDTGEQAPPPGDRYRVMAEMYLKSSYGPLMLLLTPDAAPDENEHNALVLTLAEWLRAEQAEQVSPKWAFILLAGGVVASKFSKPTVRERATMVWLKIRGAWDRITSRMRSK